MLITETLVMGEYQSNCYLLINEGLSEALFIDPGADAQALLQILNEKNLNLKYIILTHGHFDHIGAVTELAKIYNPILYMHKDDYEFLSRTDYNLSPNPSNPITAHCDEIRFVEDGEIEFLLGHTFRFIHTPGHTPGSITIKANGSLFTGDTLFYLSIGNVFPPFGNHVQELSSISNKILAMEGDMICYPGHGNLTSLDFEREHNPYVGVKQYEY